MGHRPNHRSGSNARCFPPRVLRMSKYACNTEVSPEKSRAEIERNLVRYGATGFAYGWETNSAIIGFIAQGRHVKFTLPMPTKDDKEIIYQRPHVRRPSNQIQSAIDKQTRQRWRALALAIKAKLECVESRITTFEDEFLAHIVLPNGGTVGNWLRPQIASAYASKAMPKLLGASS